MITADIFGSLPDGCCVTKYTLSTHGVSVSVMDFGATVLSVCIPDRTGVAADVLLGFGDLAGYLDNPACYGSTIGPVANRTDRAEVPLAGRIYHLPANDGPDHANNLHTDLARGLHKRLWSTELFEDDNAVRFSCELADGELGLPGNRRFAVTYRLDKEAQKDGADGGVRLEVEHVCETDAETYVNMTNHSYFNLAGHASGVCLSQRVSIDAETFLPLRADSVSAGESLSVADTPFDFRSLKELGADIECGNAQLDRARGYDHCFCVAGYARGAAPRHALRAVDDASGRTLDIFITAPGAHLYTGNWLGDEGAKDAASYGPHDGFAFEPEYYPDAVHHAEWPQPVCAPDRPYRERIVYRFGVDPDAAGASDVAGPAGVA